MNHQTVKVTNKNNFVYKGKNIPGKMEFEKSEFLLGFDYDPIAVTEGIQLLAKSAKKNYPPAINRIKEIKLNNEFAELRKLYKFSHTAEII